MVGIDTMKKDNDVNDGEQLHSITKLGLSHTICDYLFVNEHSDGKTKSITGKYILLAMGGRPLVPEIPGKEHAITSDDLFWWKHPPKKTLCVGASYISLECAGFLCELGYDVTVMVRSILLRGFDRECSEFVGQQMEKVGIKFVRESVPVRLEKTDNGQIKVHYEYAIAHSSDSEEKGDKVIKTEVFDTVIFATGRRPMLTGMNIDKAGVRIEENGKFNVNNEQTNVEHIYAVGDIVNGTPELTPVAIQAGRLLANRLFGGSDVLMDYTFVPTTVFTPMEYSCCGYSENEAQNVYGEEDLEVYHQKSTALEIDGTHREDISSEPMINCCFVKVICVKSERERIVGFHYVGPNAGEVMQGFALALNRNCLLRLDACPNVFCSLFFLSEIRLLKKKKKDKPNKSITIQKK
ncbi:hypothetical protein RFI_11587 [Reticulomyxa filosa]|uniref:Thioredoxin reductase n=1 Tax=Reticulomyxa filosa TaxID=46433 RepID=X6NGV7_RETFI|nr:hypothetical protein RFI_11587 [Reticulomyxa filosa]|eukprot:ETO25550.1 hypothetical protein RFI_11587 [Reticulomyxa filosa]